jgi:hypothetical protein
MWVGVRTDIGVADFVQRVGELIFSGAVQGAAGGTFSIGAVK